MDAQDTDPLITKHVLNMLNAWVNDYDDPPLPMKARCVPSLAKILMAQSNIGAWNTLLGRVSKQLTQLQQKHYTSKDSKRTGLRWTASLILKLQNVAWDMWEHRNGILHEFPDRHHRKQALDEANASIAKEWIRGAQGLLKQDRFLFRNKQEVDRRTLDKKMEWLAAVTAAREAANADAANAPGFEGERQRLRDWLTGSNKRAGAAQKKQKRPKKKQKITPTGGEHDNTLSTTEVGAQPRTNPGPVARGNPMATRGSRAPRP